MKTEKPTDTPIEKQESAEVLGTDIPQTQEPVQTQPPQPVTPIVTPKSNKTLLLISAVLLAIALLAGGGYWAYQNYLVQKPFPTTTPSPSPTSDVTANWKTYTSKSEKFSFMYPEELFTADSDETRLSFYSSQDKAKEAKECEEKGLGTLQKPCSAADMVLNIGVLINPTPNDSPQLINPKEYKDNQGRIWLIGDIVEIAGAYNFDATLDYKGTKYAVGIQAGRGGFEKFVGKTLIIDLGEGKYDNSKFLEEHEKIAKQILSTFKFLDSATSNMSNWETYSNTFYNLEFRYPPTYIVEENQTGGGFQVILNKGASNEMALGISPKGIADTDLFLDTPSRGQKTIGAYSWREFYLPQGYPDGGETTVRPVYVVRIVQGDYDYTARVFGSSLSAEQTQILSTFKFMVD